MTRPLLHIRSFQLSQRCLSACWISASPLARISADCVARILAIARDLPSALRESLAIAPRQGRGVIFRGHPDIQAQRDRIGNPSRVRVSRTPASTHPLRASRCAAGRCRPAAAGRHPSRAHSGRIAEPHRRSGFRSIAAAAVDAQHVALNFREVFLAQLGAGHGGAGVLGTESQYSGGSGSSGVAVDVACFRTASAARFSICFGVGIRQLAGRSVMPELEHNKNKCRVGDTGNLGVAR